MGLATNRSKPHVSLSQFAGSCSLKSVACARTRVDLLRPQKSKMGRTRGWAWESPVRRTLDEDERKSFKASEGRGGACNK